MSMGARRVFTPLGTARAAWLAAHGALGPREAALSVLTDRAQAAGLGADTVALAWELARIPENLTDDERLRLTEVAVALLLAEARGHTQMPLVADGEGSLEVTLDALGAREHTAKARALLADPRCAPIVGRYPARSPLVLVGGGPSGEALATERTARCEAELVTALRARASTVPPEPSPAAVRKALEAVLACPSRRPDGEPVRLHPEQESAVAIALGRRLTTITGGPGTGKTSLVVALLRTAVRVGLAPADIALAAPTGKAAQRLDDAVRRALDSAVPPAPPTRSTAKRNEKQLSLFGAGAGDVAERAPGPRLLPDDARLRSELRKPETLHRFLGYSPSTGRFRHHERAQVAARLVVVDEASMIDVELMDRLLRALPENASLVLLGDADQLPSVEAGAVFRDLVAAGQTRGFCARLTNSYRMSPTDPSGSAVYTTAQALLRGTVPELPRAVESASGLTLRFTGVEVVDVSFARAGEAFLRTWYGARLRGDDAHRARVVREYAVDGEGRFLSDDDEALRALLRHHEGARLLAFTREDGAATSAARLNAALLGLLRDDLEASRLTLREDDTLVPGAPVLVVHNDYGRNLFNGDQGVVVSMREGRGRKLAVVFARTDGLVWYPRAALGDLVTPAFAMTVHKSQGSEYSHVGVVLPEQDGPLLTRELLYTAVTRASKSVTLVGRHALLETGVARPTIRRTGLAQSLAQGP